MNLHRGGLQQLNFSKIIFFKFNKSYATKCVNVEPILNNGTKIDHESIMKWVISIHEKYFQSLI